MPFLDGNVKSLNVQVVFLCWGVRGKAVEVSVRAHP